MTAFRSSDELSPQDELGGRPHSFDADATAPRADSGLYGLGADATAARVLAHDEINESFGLTGRVERTPIDRRGITLARSLAAAARDAALLRAPGLTAKEKELLLAARSNRRASRPSSAEPGQVE